jgi:hypothetical protein
VWQISKHNETRTAESAIGVQKFFLKEMTFVLLLSLLSLCYATLDYSTSVENYTIQWGANFGWFFLWILE